MKKILLTTGLYAAVVFVLIYSLFPFYYAIITSFKTGTALFGTDLFPTDIKFDNYVSVFSQNAFVSSVFNSIFVSVVVVFLALLLGLTSAYALSRIRFRGRSSILLMVLSISMFPQIALLAGLFEMVMGLGLYNTLSAMILSYMIFTLPFTVWVLTNYMKELPQELEEAAMVDGAPPWIILTKIFLPLLWPAMVTTGLLAFIAAWNEFMFALTFTSSIDKRTIPVAIALLSGATPQEIPWGNLMAASVAVTVPLVALVLVFQRKILSGLMAGAVKG